MHIDFQVEKMEVQKNRIKFRHVLFLAILLTAVNSFGVPSQVQLHHHHVSPPKHSVYMSVYGDRGSGGGGRSGGGNGGGGGSRFSSRGPTNRFVPLGRGYSSSSSRSSFSTTSFRQVIPIDPNLRTSVMDMPFSAITRNALLEKGFDTMTPVQAQSYPIVFSGVDIVARSKTGTGKTFAFGLPLLEKMVSLGQHTLRRGLPLMLVLEPTRELALQVTSELASVCNRHGVQVLAVFGGSSLLMQGTVLYIPVCMCV